jgi:hypothetical protein
LRRGKDYEYRTYIMAQMVRNAASKKRLSITIGVSEDEQSIHVTVNGRKDSCEYYRRTGRYEGGLVGSM